MHSDKNGGYRDFSAKSAKLTSRRRTKVNIALQQSTSHMQYPGIRHAAGAVTGTHQTAYLWFRERIRNRVLHSEGDYHGIRNI